MQKSDGSYWLAIWNEGLVGAHAVTVKLATPAGQIKVFTPLTSASPVQAIGTASSVTVNVTAAPVLVAVTPATGGTTPPPPPNTISTSASNTTINANAGTTFISVYGTGDTINGSSGTYTVQAFKGNNTINTGAGTATVYVGGTNNKVVIGSGTATINDSGNSNTFSFAAPGTGRTHIYGYVLSQNDTLDFRTLLAGTQWNGSAATVGNFLIVTNQGGNSMVSVNTSGAAGGATYPVVTLHGYGYLTLATLTPHATF